MPKKKIEATFEDIFSEKIKREETKHSLFTTDFETEPVGLRTFVQDKSFLNLPPLSQRQFDAVEIATQIYFPSTLEELHWPKRRYCRDIVLMWGKGSGKDYISRITLLRIAYLLLCLRTPQAYFYSEQTQNAIERIDMLNTAANDAQAVNVFFSPLRQYIKTCPFFKNRCEILTHEVRFEKSIHLHSGHSEAEPMEGMNLIAVVLDEIAAFKTDEEVAELKRGRARKNIPRSASSMYDFATTSVITRFPKTGKIVLISFPRFKGDFITTKYEEGKNDPNVYVSKGATFEINPMRTAADFEELKRKNPELYKCRILAEPGYAEDAFFKNEVALRAAFKKEVPSPVDEQTGKLKSWFMCKDGNLRYGHVDLAKNRDRAAFAFVHAFDIEQKSVFLEEKNETVIVEQPKIRVDIIRYFEAPPGGEVDFDKVLNGIIELEEDRGFRFGCITFDGFQSVQMRQALEKRGIIVDEQSVDRTRDAYETLQDLIYSGRLEGYYDKILMEKELPFLIDVKGRKIDHRTGKSKDGADALAGAVNNCIMADSWGESSFWTG